MCNEEYLFPQFIREYCNIMSSLDITYLAATLHHTKDEIYIEIFE